MERLGKKEDWRREAGSSPLESEQETRHGQLRVMDGALVECVNPSLKELKAKRVSERQTDREKEFLPHSTLKRR